MEQIASGTLARQRFLLVLFGIFAGLALLLACICIGACIGLLAGFAAARLLKHFVDGVRSTDPLTFVVMISVLVLAALFASFLPARHASRTEPMSALRQE